jgi:hypothetical protein
LLVNRLGGRLLVIVGLINDRMQHDHLRRGRAVHLNVMDTCGHHAKTRDAERQKEYQGGKFCHVHKLRTGPRPAAQGQTGYEGRTGGLRGRGIFERLARGSCRAHHGAQRYRM